MKKTIKNLFINSMNGVLQSRGYAIKPLGNDHKKINILSLDPFGRLAKSVLNEGMTCLKEDRLYTLWQVLNQVINLNGDIAEIGVFRGGSAKFIASGLRLNGKDDIVLHLFDTFEGMPDQQVEVDKRRRGGFEKTSLDMVKSYLSDFSNVRFYKGFVQDNARMVNNRKFSMVHIDVDIYEPYKFCLEFFGNRLIVGGSMVLDDYGFITCPGAKKAAEEYVRNNSSAFLMLHLLTGQAIITKIR